jgi:hypothetical protein
MIYITGAGGATASVNDNMTVSGDPYLRNLVNTVILEVQPQLTKGVSPLAFLYYELLKRNVNAEIDPADLKETDMPPTATP